MITVASPKSIRAGWQGSVATCIVTRLKPAVNSITEAAVRKYRRDTIPSGFRSGSAVVRVNSIKRTAVVAAGMVAASVAACGGTSSASSPVAGPNSDATPAMRALVATWASYKQVFIAGGGRVIDPERQGATTSEGQAYALLRAVWMDDRTTFDSVWNWTYTHLWLPSSQRFGYLWASGGSSSLSSRDSATDADQDIALALLFAARLWKNPPYRYGALEVLRGIWVNEVSTLGGIPYVLAGNWAKHGDSATAEINPSYLAPYAYRIFSTVDSSHPWMSLVTSSYAALSSCSQAPLRAGKSVGLPPNWCVIRRSDGQAASFSAASDGDNYGYDAFRVMWRVALDLRWFNSPSASAYLQQQSFLRQQWTQHNSLASVYGHGGSVEVNFGDPTIYGGDIGAFAATDPGAVKAILERQLTSSYHAGSPAYFGDAKNYYEQNWVWFGIAFGAGALPNLAG